MSIQDRRDYATGFRLCVPVERPNAFHQECELEIYATEENLSARIDLRVQSFKLGHFDDLPQLHRPTNQRICAACKVL
jgi:hypothetical protein